MTFVLALLQLFVPALPDTLADDAMGHALQAAVRAYAEPLDDTFDAAASRTEWVDLNGDDRLDALVFLEGTAWCGSSGCTLLIMEATTPEDAAELGAFTPAAEISLMHAPVHVAATRTGGWRDLMVEDAEGAWRRLSFDGETYPFSPADGEPLAQRPDGDLVLFAEGSH